MHCPPKHNSNNSQQNPDSERTQQRRGSCRAIIIDDVEIIRICLHDMLSTFDIEASVFAKANTAISHFGSSAHQYDLILVDIILGQDCGLQLLDEMRAVRPDIKTILMSGYSHTHISTYVSQPNTVFLPKPFGLEDLKTALAKLVIIN